MSGHEYDYETVAGLPGDLPDRERVLWQGSPTWLSFLTHALHVRWIAGYFALLMVWRFASGLHDGMNLQAALISGAWIVPLAAIVIAIMAGFALAVSRTTIYSITSRRVVFRFGVAVPIAVNVPFSQIVKADLHTFNDGTGQIPLTIGGQDRFAFLVLWPHAMGWQINNPQPMIRSIPDSERVAAILATALAASVSANASSSPASLSGPVRLGAEASPVRAARPLVTAAA
jgi:Bacterial PH domain